MEDQIAVIDEADKLVTPGLVSALGLLRRMEVSAKIRPVGDFHPEALAGVDRPPLIDGHRERLFNRTGQRYQSTCGFV